MPRTTIRRDQTGGPVQPAGQGNQSRVVVADVTYPAALGAAVQGHADIIWRTATGATALHNTARSRNMPLGAIGYIHSINNVCLAVSRLDVQRGTIELCGNVGHVNGGVHIF
ncbi:MAG: hypothetical protein KDA85_07860 [Planctomycetaceae bacterium]|nr:hypothetical protein [Planctomycetaceae bacterium]